MAIADDRSKAVELALAQIEKQFGKGSIVRLGSKEALVPIAVISTGGSKPVPRLLVMLMLRISERDQDVQIKQTFWDQTLPPQVSSPSRL